MPRQDDLQMLVLQQNTERAEIEDLGSVRSIRETDVINEPEPTMIRVGEVTIGDKGNTAQQNQNNPRNKTKSPLSRTETNSKAQSPLN